jgi:uncharacterized protein YhbP (UPF0306 family)
VWLSHPGATHSQNIRERGTTAVAVFDSTQSWGKPDRGIQLFGAAVQLDHEAADAAATYAARFPESRNAPAAYRFYEFRPTRVKLFDERAFGAGRFVRATLDADGRLSWEATDVYPVED